MAMSRMWAGMWLAGAAAAMLLPAAGAAARNIKAKPAPAVCVEARERGQILPGCPRPDTHGSEAPSARGAGAPPSADAKPDANIARSARPS